MSALPPIPSTSPTLAEAMRSCMLRAGLSRLRAVNRYVLGNPKAWLGTAYHKVLERLPELAAVGDGADTLLDGFWQDEIRKLAEQAAAHPLNARFGEPQFWRGYHLVLATARLRVAELAGSVSPSPQPRGSGVYRTFREERLTAFGGKLNGTPDLGREDEIIDFKTGSIYETTDLDTPPVLKQAYVRQLQIYAYLVGQRTGHPPRRGRLYPIAGPPVEVALNPSECTQVAADAVTLLDHYNQEAVRAASPADLASPSPASCQWCPFKLVCPSFWQAADESWNQQLDGEAVRGVLTAPTRSVHAGTAYGLSLQVTGGTLPQQGISLAPLQIGVHPQVGGLPLDTPVRAVGLRQRGDGTCYATERTVVLPEGGIPALDTIMTLTET